MFTHRSTVHLNPVVVQMEIAKEVVGGMLAGLAIDFCLNAAPARPISERLYRHVTHLLVNESEAAIMLGRDSDKVNQDTWHGVANEVITPGAKGASWYNLVSQTWG